MSRSGPEAAALRERAPAVGRIWALTGVLALLAALLHSLLLGQDHPGGVPHVPWLVLVAAFAVAERAVVYLRAGNEAISLSLSELVLVLGLYLSTPTEIVSAAVVGGGLVLALHHRQAPVKLAFNAAHTWLGAVLAVALWHAVAGADPYSLTGSVAALLAAVTAELVASFCVEVVVALRDRRRIRRPTAVTRSLLAACANAAFALVVIEVLRTDWHGVWALLVLAGFLGLAQRAHVALVRRHDALEALQALARQVGRSDLDQAAVVEHVLRGAREALSVDAVVLHLAGEGGGTWTCDEHGTRQETAGGRSGSRPAGGSSVTVELTAALGVTGSLTATDRRGERGGLDGGDRSLLEALASHASMALHNCRLTQRLQEQVVASAHQALHDPLTGLPNRLAFERAVTDVLATAPTSAVLLLDLDRFKEVNDTLGHAAGDAVLCETAVRVRRRLPPGCVVARLGGDEFAVLIPDATVGTAYEVAAAVRAVLLEPLEVEGLRLTVDASVGVARSPQHGADLATLMRHADTAMYAAKEAQIGVCVYDADSDGNSTDRLSLITDLRAGIDGGELVLVYQPKTATTGRRVVGVEALVRWQHPVRGTVPPGDFISVAERTGLIGPMTEWVIREAVEQCRRWLDTGLALGVAVNISPRTLQDPLFVSRLRGHLARAGLPPALLTLEITEDGVMSDPERAIRVLEELRAVGVRTSLDDLGVGHSSLAHLRRLPLDEVKIDRSFVAGITQRSEDEAIIEALLTLGTRLGLVVVAEGVEDEVTFDVLAGLGAPVAQGYWMSRPLPAADVPRWVAAWCRAPALPEQRVALA